MSTETKATTDLDEIRRFAESCEAVPATVRATMEGDEPGVLTLDVLGHGAGEEALEHIDWEAWYEKFRSAGLAFLYQGQKADGEPSTFFKLVSRKNVDDVDEEGSQDAGEPPAPGDTKVTTDLDEIRRFAEGREAVPATVRATMEGDEPGVLRLDFLGYGAGEEALEHIDWEAWHEKFRSSGLAFLYQDRKADGELSTFFKLVSRKRVDDGEDRPEGREDADGGSTGGPSQAGQDAPSGDSRSAGRPARVRATVGASGAGSGGTLRVTVRSSGGSGEDGSDEEGSHDAGEPPAPGDTKVTTDLDEIRRFAEGREAVPATVRATMEGDEPGVLTLDVLGHGAGEEALEHIDWEAWYEKFRSAGLAFLYQDRKADGELSTFFKLVSRERAET